MFRMLQRRLATSIHDQGQTSLKRISEHTPREPSNNKEHFVHGLTLPEAFLHGLEIIVHGACEILTILSCEESVDSSPPFMVDKHQLN